MAESRGSSSRLHSAADIEFRPVPFGDAEVRSLIDDVQREYAGIYGSGDRTPLQPEMFDPPDGLFLVGFADGGAGAEAVVMGGWRRRVDIPQLVEGHVVELKRMYVVPSRRGTGLAQLMLTRLEDTARAAGAELMILETGQPQTAAVALYRGAGYADTVRFGYYADEPSAVYLSKRL